MSTDPRSRAWVEVRAPAIRRNLQTVRDRVGGDAALIPMVKANAYGLGVERAVEVLEPVGPWGYGVATAEEGRKLREIGVSRPVLVFSPLPPGEYGIVVRERLIPCLSELGAVQRLRQAAEEVGVSVSFHVEVDTGMGRAGFDWRGASSWAERVRELSGGQLAWTGLFTHFHSADEMGGATVVGQWERFQEAVRNVGAPAADFMLHACNSAAALRLPEVAAGGVRPGIFLYGGVAGQDLPDPEPVVSVRARVVLVKDVEVGATVGYGATHRAAGARRWATVAIGYGDGLPRALGNRGTALVRGQEVPIVGRISMDMTVVDITGVEGVETGEVVTFIGTDGGAAIRLERVAELASTINYEILTGLTPRLPRIWSDDHGY